MWYAIHLEKAKQTLGHAHQLNIEDRTVGPANAAPQGLSENIVCALKLATNLAEGNPMERIVQGVTEATNTQMVWAMSQFISADNDKARVCMGFFLRSTTFLAPHLDLEPYLEAYVKEGPDELTLRVEEGSAQKAFFVRPNIEEHRWKPPLENED